MTIVHFHAINMVLLDYATSILMTSNSKSKVVICNGEIDQRASYLMIYESYLGVVSRFPNNYE